VGRVARGDLGRSIQQNRPVAAELADAWPATLELTVAALVIATVAGIAAGVASAVRPNSLFDGLARLGSLFGLSMPIFWTGLVLIVVFSLWLNWLPVGGAGSLTHLILPAVTLALPSVAMIARMTRAAVLDVLREDYVRTARAKGLGTECDGCRGVLTRRGVEAVLRERRGDGGPGGAGGSRRECRAGALARALRSGAAAPDREARETRRQVLARRRRVRA